MNRIVPEGEVDPGLQEKLRQEYPGILAWAVRGCLSWQGKGLPSPAVVEKATNRWKAYADVVGRFVTERCEFDPAAEIGSSELYGAYKDWCADNKESSQTQSGFKTSLLSYDVNPAHTRRGNVWRGICLRA